MTIHVYHPTEDVAVGWVNKLRNNYYIGSVNYFLYEPPSGKIYNRGNDPFTYPQIIQLLNLD